jgi:hypothetical protein
MKLFLPVFIFLIFAAGCGKIQTEAQIRASNTGWVSNTNTKKANTLDISTVDFKNFTFPAFNDKPAKTFTLKNGATETKNVYPRYSLRKTYYFDLTDDEKDEAVSHIIVDGCAMGCESSNLFYIHTAEENEPRLLWKIATGGDVLGGLKSAHFKSKEIILEAFGECSLENGVIKPKIDIKTNARLKTSSYTRFVFALGENGFTQSTKDVLPLPANINLIEYRPQISFGNQK